MAAVQAAENHGDERSLAWYLWWGIYTSIPTWTHLQNSLAAEPLSFIEFKDIFPRNISQLIPKTIILSKRIDVSYVMKHMTLFWIWLKVNGN